MDQRVRIFDTTMRDGEQSPGATLTSSEKLEIARGLARMGVAIIEDEADIAGVLANCFACEGFQVMTARDGEVGLDVIQRHRPDLIVLDLMLPSMTGWDMFRYMKTDKSLQNIPVVVLSANSDVANRISLLEQGVDDYIVKPCSVREVIARARAVLRRGERSSLGREAHDTQRYHPDCR